MSVHRRFLSILAETISKFETMSVSPVGALAQLQRDKDVVRREIQDLLDWYAAKHGIPPSEARHLYRGYIEVLVGDLFVDREEELDRKIEAMPSH
jgi:hypothetical protein